MRGGMGFFNQLGSNIIYGFHTIYKFSFSHYLYILIFTLFKISYENV